MDVLLRVACEPDDQDFLREKNRLNFARMPVSGLGSSLLREFFPKGHDFAIVTDEELARAVRLINNRPRKCLNWKSAYEAFMDELSHLA